MGQLLQKLHWVRYQVGRLFFPVVEPLFILRENLRTAVRRHFDQAIQHIENQNFTVAQLNLNRVLSLHPNHFLAHVYRGRIFLRQKQYRMASEDLVQANRISPFRFTHYRLYREYLEAIGEGIGAGGGSSPARGMGRLEGFHLSPNMKGHESLEAPDHASAFEDSIDMEEDPLMVIQDLDLTLTEREKFGDMGPITPQESENADWDHVLKKLTS
jgi:tetratricopeptide (TPR) repeat protein